MNIQLPKNARTTPAIRLELQSQPEAVTREFIHPEGLVLWPGPLSAPPRLKTLMPQEEGAKMPVKPFKA